tara:strand:- start:1918 stop:3174 length:1257 start_codon:yes stop_codon:yes gene_type:complete
MSELQDGSVSANPLKVFGYRDFLYLWASTGFMTVANALRILVSLQWLYEATGSATQLGLLGVVQLLQLPVALYGGMLADRINRKMLMVVCQFAAAAMLIVITVLAFTELLKPWHIFVVTGLSGIVAMLGVGARPAMLPRVIPRYLLPHAVTVQVATRQVAMVGVPLIFWQVFERFGASVGFTVAASCAVLSTIAPGLIRASGSPDTASATTRVSEAFKEGFWFIMRHRLLPGLYLLDIGVVIVSFYRELFPVFADQLYGLGAEGTGLLSSADAVGGIIGTFLVFSLNKVGRKGLIVLVSTFVYAIFLIAFGLNTSFALGLVVIAVLGLTDAISMTMRQSVVQLTTPDRLLGRASSAHSFAAMGANHIGHIEVGVMAGLIGAGATMVFGGAASILVVSAIWFCLPGVRKYDQNGLEPQR